MKLHEDNYSLHQFNLNYQLKINQTINNNLILHQRSYIIIIYV